MITIFTIPKPFVGYTAVIQINSIKSWLQIVPADRVILFGEETGIAEAAAELGVVHEAVIAQNSHGTPLLNDAFEKAHQMSETDCLCYVNCDIILTSGFLHAFSQLKSRYRFFLAIGRRMDVPIDHLIDFTEDWEKRLALLVHNKGCLHNHSGIDYFLFSKSLFKNIPAFAVGRVGWDNWMISHAVKSEVPVIDMTDSFKAIHQNHDYSHLCGGQKERDFGREAEDNFKLAGERKNFFTIRDATHKLTPQGIQKRRDPYCIYRWIVERSDRNQFYNLLFKILRFTSRMINKEKES